MVKKREVEGEKKLFTKLALVSENSNQHIPHGCLLRPIKFIMSPFTCTQTLHYVNGGKLSLYKPVI